MIEIDEEWIRDNPPSREGLDLSEEEEESWDLLVKTLMENNVELCAADNHILEIYCREVSLARRLSPGVYPKDVLSLREVRAKLLMTNASRREHGIPEFDPNNNPFERL